MKVVILAPYNFKDKDGNTLRPELQCMGLVENGYEAFELKSRHPAENAPYRQSKIKKGFWSWIPQNLRPLGFFNYLFDLPFWSKIEIEDSSTIVHAHNFDTFFILPKNCIRVADLHTFKSNEMYFNYSNPVKGSWLKRRIYKYPLTSVVRYLEKQICNKADKIIVASENVGEEISKKFNVSKDKFIVINNAVNTSNFKINQHAAPFTVGVVGGFKDQINREVIPEIVKIAHLTKHTIVLIGSIFDEDRKLFEDIANVEVLGRISDQEFANWMSRMSVLLAPYTTNRHGGGLRNKVMEAAVSATPIVTTIGGAEGFGNNELLFIGETPEGLVKHIESLEDANTRKIIGEKLRTYAIKHFDYLKESKKLKELYISLIDRKYEH